MLNNKLSLILGIIVLLLLLSLAGEALLYYHAPKQSTTTVIKEVVAQPSPSVTVSPLPTASSSAQKKLK